MKHGVIGAVGLAFGCLVSAGYPASATSYTNTMAQTTAYITNQMAAGNLAGVSIVLVDDQEVVWSRGFGFADREQGVPADADTVFHIGSVSKSFAATAVMQLMDDGRVDLEAPLTNYMTEFAMLPRFTNSGPVTIRSLLNHHSGLPGDFFNSMWTTPLRDDYISWLIGYLQGDYTFAPVDERYAYCNTGWVLISDVVRRIDGRSFAAATDARIFTPLGMNASSFIPDKPAISNRLAACYDANGVRQPPEYVNCLGSGSMYSSANDMARYIQMLLAGGQYNGQTILSSNALTVMTTPQLTNLPLNVQDIPQGLGWDDADDARFRYAGRAIWKDGATMYFCSFLVFSPDLKLGVAVIQNTAGGQCDSIGAEALRWAIQDKFPEKLWPTNTYVPPASPITNRPQSELDALAGLYVGVSGYHKVVAETGTLTFVADAQSDTPAVISNLVPRANGWFSRTNSQSTQLAFTNLAGHDMLVQHEVSGPRESASSLGEHYIPGSLSAAWSARTNRTYRIVDMGPFDYLWSQPGERTLRLSVKDGALLATWTSGIFVLEPQTDSLAFQRGVHYRSGGAMRVFTTNGYELLQHSSYRFLDEAAIPTLAVPAITNGAIPFANGIQWYGFTGRAGQTYRVMLAAPGQNYFVRLTDRGGTQLGASTNQLLSWTCSADGTYAIAVNATNVFSYTISVAACGLRPMQSDYDADRLADPAIYVNSVASWGVALSASGYARNTLAMGGTDSLESSADYDGDGKADPAVYEPTTGRLLIGLSAQGYALVAVTGGDAGCVPVCGDFDGDLKADPSVYSAAASQFIIKLSGTGYAVGGATLGGTGWMNASEDYDGDGKTDPAVYDAQSGSWRVMRSTQGYTASSLSIASSAGGIPVTGDYDGDGRADPTAYLASSGWMFALSSQNYAPAQIPGFGGATLVPRPGDYDADGKTDPALYDSATRTFYVLKSGSNYQLSVMPW